jgi:hypothetical protein
MLLHAEQLAAATAEYLCPTAAAAVFRSSLAQLSVAHGRAAKGPRLLLRRTAKAGTTPDVSASKSLLAPFIGLYLVMGAVLHSKSLTATNRPDRRRMRHTHWRRALPLNDHVHLQDTSEPSG